jgi:hypothetical protein
MNTVRLTPIIDADDPDVTELVELDARSVHGVRTPASGSPFALVKSARDEPGVLHLSAGGASQAEIDAFMAKAGYRRADGAAKSSSAESDAIMQAVSGELDPREEAQRRHPETGQFVSGEDGAVLSAQELARAERELEASDDPDERARLAEVVTLGRLRASYNGTAPAAPDVRKVSDMATATKSQVNLPAAIKRLEQLHPQLPQGSLKEEVGEELTKCRLMTMHAVKSVQKQTRAEADRQASVDSIRAAQEKASTPAPKARTSSPRAALEGVRDGTAPVRSLGLQGRTGGVEQYDPHAEPDPLVQAAVIEDELAKATDPLVRQRLGEDLTVARLRALHGGSRLAAPRALAKAAKGGKKARKAAKRAAARRATLR